MQTISEHEGSILIDGHPVNRQEAIQLLYTGQAVCDATVVDQVLLAAEIAGEREKRRGPADKFVWDPFGC